MAAKTHVGRLVMQIGIGRNRFAALRLSVFAFKFLRIAHIDETIGS
jgi:hypothetical protein